MAIKRRRAKVIKIGSVRIGGDYVVAIQSMAKTATTDIDKTVAQIKRLEGFGCEIVRLAVGNSSDALALRKIKASVKIPLVADIHFDWRLALAAIDNGADKIRLNPGNIYKKAEVREIVCALKQNKIPLRIGVNSGSVRTDTTKRLSMPDKLVKCALDYLKLVEAFKFYDNVISLKGSNVRDTLCAYRKIAKLCDYPLHLGVTASGFPFSGAIKSGIALGALLLEGIGDTIRVSLTDRPEREIETARTILEALGLRHFRPEVISCPTCGRCQVDLVGIVKELESKLSTIPARQRFSGGDYRLSTRPPKVAVMGCVVNGPGEAKEADIGIAFGKREGLLFRKGRPIKKVSSDKCIGILIKEISKSNQKPEYRNQSFDKLRTGGE